MVCGVWGVVSGRARAQPFPALAWRRELTRSRNNRAALSIFARRPLPLRELGRRWCEVSHRGRQAGRGQDVPEHQDDEGRQLRSADPLDVQPGQVSHLLIGDLGSNRSWRARSCDVLAPNRPLPGIGLCEACCFADSQCWPICSLKWVCTCPHLSPFVSLVRAGVLSLPHALPLQPDGRPLVLDPRHRRVR